VLGSQVLSILCRELPEGAAVHVITRDATAALGRVNLAVQCALHFGRTPRVTCEQVDVRNRDRAAQAIATFRPDVVFSTLTRQSWWVPTRLPARAAARLAEARFGPWLPMHLSRVRDLVLAIRDAGSDAVVVNAAFPDAVHPVLAAVGIAPHLGIGNIANVVPGVRLGLADRLGVPVGRLEVLLYAAHYVSHRVSRHGDPGEAPFLLRVLLDGTDITGHLDVDNPFAGLPTTYRRPGGTDGQPMTASSAAAVLRAVLGDRAVDVHAPGPGGLPGGYAVRVSRAGAEVTVPVGSTVEDLVEVNRAGLAADGIEAIDGLGGVTFRDREASVLADVLGYKCSYLPLADVDARADELATRYGRYAAGARA
jgi:hypothetical protein